MQKWIYRKNLSAEIKIILSFILCSLLILVQGCGSASKINSLPTLANDTVLAVDQGLVVARVINASGYPLPFNQLTLTPDNINESNKIKWQKLESINPQVNGNTTFASPIKSGTYSLKGISSLYQELIHYGSSGFEINEHSRIVRADPEFSSFEVKANQVTDLGTIIFYTKPQDDHSLDMLVRLPQNKPGEILDRYFEFYKYDKNDILSWNEDGLENERQALFSSLAQNPISFNKTYMSPDKSLYFLGKFGILIKRTNLGSWELDAVDSNLDLTAIAENNRGDLAIGDSEGGLFWKQAGKEWRDISLDHEFHILDLSFGDDKTLTLLTKKKTELLVLRANSNSKRMEWKEINRYDSRNGWKNSDSDSGVTRKMKRKALRIIWDASIFTIGDLSYVRVETKWAKRNSFFSETKDITYRFNPNDWFTSELEDDLKINIVRNAGTTKLGIKTPLYSPPYSPVHLTHYGLTMYYRYLEESGLWDKMETRIYKCRNGKYITHHGCDFKRLHIKQNKRSFSFLDAPWFKNELEAIAVVRFGLSGEIKIVSTKNGGKSWVDTEYELPKEYCHSLVTQLSDRLILGCDGSSSDFYESTDNGASWKHVRQQENF